MPTAKQAPETNTGQMKMDNKIVLQALLHQLQEGVIVCAPDGTITMFNNAAADLLGGRMSISVGASLYRLCLQPPVEHALNLLRYQKKTSGEGAPQPPYIQFINATAGQNRFLRCRLSLLESPKGGKPFMILCKDVSAWYRPDNLLFMKIDEFRGPMTNLRAAVENLTEHPEMSPVMRSAFENVLVQESLNLTEAFTSLDKACDHLIQAQSHLIELQTAVLFGFLAKHFSRKKIIFTPAPDQTASVKVDSYGLLLVLAHLAEKIKRRKKLTKLHCKAHTGDKFVYFDFFWTGKIMLTAAVESLQQEKIQRSVGDMTVAAMLHSMGGDIWSQQHDASTCILRLALPLTPGPQK